MNFLEGGKYVWCCTVNKFVVDECAMSDSNYANILKGII